MKQNELRTYRRREVTRTSGYHTCEETTGGECLIKYSESFLCNKDKHSFCFHRSKIEMVPLFDNDVSILGFGGYIKSKCDAQLDILITYKYENTIYKKGLEKPIKLEKERWKNVGLHVEQRINIENSFTDINVNFVVNSKKGNILEFICFDLDVIKKEEFLDKSCAVSFYQKTSMHIPYLYYLETDLPFNHYLTSKPNLKKGSRIILKSCNRCGRFLPINIDDEIKTLSFALHCKKKAPCTHSSFRSYKIINLKTLDKKDLKGLTIEGDRVVSYYGHQLECKACKKFFVNAPLNPQRNAQQFKEDGLRRRAIEVLVNTLLQKNLIHFEYKKLTKKEFSEYIWNKFDRRCFKCGPNSQKIKLEEMALDHTMPLAYLYRLDETATCLCSSHNSQKSDTFPVDYYSESELKRLSKITGIDIKTIHKKEINHEVLNLLIENIVWFYDEFLMSPDYQKTRDGILTANKINDSLKRVIGKDVDLAEEYKKITGHYPSSISTE